MQSPSLHSLRCLCCTPAWCLLDSQRHQDVMRAQCTALVNAMATGGLLRPQCWCSSQRWTRARAHGLRDHIHVQEIFKCSPFSLLLARQPSRRGVRPRWQDAFHRFFKSRDSIAQHGTHDESSEWIMNGHEFYPSSRNRVSRRVGVASNQTILQRTSRGTIAR